MQSVITKKNQKTSKPNTTRQFIRLINQKTEELNKMLSDVLDLDAEFVRFILRKVFAGKTVSKNLTNTQYLFKMNLTPADRAVLRRNIALSSKVRVVDFGDTQMSYFGQTVNGQHYLCFRLSLIKNDLTKPMTEQQQSSVIYKLGASLVVNYSVS